MANERKRKLEGAQDELPAKRPRVEWECPVCFQLRFPLSGKCGHCVCEICYADVYNCPECRMVDSFEIETPNWPLAKLYNLERAPSTGDFEFSVYRDCMGKTRRDLSRVFAMFCNLDDIVTSETLDNTRVALNRIYYRFNKDICTMYTNSLVSRFDKARKYPLEIDITKCPVIYRDLCKFVEDKHPTIHCRYEKGDRVIMHLKPKTE